MIPELLYKANYHCPLALNIFLDTLLKCCLLFLFYIFLCMVILISTILNYISEYFLLTDMENQVLERYFWGYQYNALI